MIRRSTLILVCWSALTCGVHAQAPTPPPTPAPAPPTLSITGPASFARDTLGQYAVTASTGAPPKTAWLVYPRTSQAAYGNRLVFTGQPGKYVVIAFAINGNEPAILQQTVEITGQVAPPVPVVPPVTVKPPVQPPIQPPTRPVPVIPQVGPISGSLFLLAVYDKAQLGTYLQSQQDLIRSTSLRLALQPLDIFWWPYEIQNDVVGQWKAQAQAVGLPAMLIVGKESTLVPDGTAYPLPADEASVMRFANQLRGR